MGFSKKHLNQQCWFSLCSASHNVIEHIAAGILLYRNHHAVHIGIGIVVVSLAGTTVAFLVFASLIVITLAVLVLLFSGVSNVLTGIVNSTKPSLAKSVM
ncbi:MAG: hypothetical protein M3251_00850 [Thermoproteota archaeon]|nr:hypothetical protein [Thermoproteota archaeon]